MIEFSSVALSDQGPRTVNEDRVASHAPDDDVLERRGALFALADGLGGHGGGAIASDTAITTLVTDYYAVAHHGIEAALRGAVQAANLAVLGAAQREARYRSMATTLDALVLTPRSAYVAHVGDGRVYQLRSDDLRCLTQDHSEVAQLVRMRVLAPERVRRHPGRNTLTRTLGGGLIVRPDLMREPVVAGDRYLLCSDGLWSAVDDAEIVEVLHDADATTACRTLVELALTHGADDNVTVQVVDVTAVEAPSGAAITEGESGGILRRIADRLIG